MMHRTRDRIGYDMLGKQARDEPAGGGDRTSCAHYWLTRDFWVDM
jgi:hypothetical protein